MTPEERHEELMAAMQAQQDDILLIKTKIVGNEHLQIKGLSETVEEQSSEIQKLKKEHNDRIAVLEADKNKVLGALWVACSSAFLGLLAFIGTFFRK